MAWCPPVPATRASAGASFSRRATTPRSSSPGSPTCTAYPSSQRRALAKHNFGLNLGYTYAVNDNLALNTSLLGLYRNSASVDGTTIPPPNERYFLQFGMTWLLARGLFLEPAVAVRVGGSSPDLTFSLNLPYSF